MIEAINLSNTNHQSDAPNLLSGKFFIISLCCLSNIVFYVLNGEITRALAVQEPKLNCAYFLAWFSHTPLVLCFWGTKLCNKIRGAVDAQAPCSGLGGFPSKARPIAANASQRADSATGYKRKAWCLDNDGEVKSGSYKAWEGEEGCVGAQAFDLESIHQAQGNGTEEANLKGGAAASAYKRFDEYIFSIAQLNFFPRYLVQCMWITCLFALNAWFWSKAVGNAEMSVGTVTAIFNTNPAFVLLITLLVSKDTSGMFTSVVALFLALVGVSLIAYHSEGEPRNIAGIIMAFGSSFLYATFEIVYKVYVINNSGVSAVESVCLFMGMMGLIYVTVLWIPIPLLHTLDLEKLRMPSAYQWLLLVCNCICVSAYQASLQISFVFLRSPFLVSLAGLTCMPIANFADWLLRTGAVTTPEWVGSCLVLASFLLMLTHDEHKSFAVKNSCVTQANNSLNNNTSSYRRNLVSDKISYDPLLLRDQAYQA